MGWGTHWYYSSGDCLLLSGIIQKSTGLTAHEFARRHLFEPLGLTDMIWLADPAGQTITAWGIQGTLRDWIRESSKPVSEDVKKYGYQWWRLSALGNHEGSKIPPDILIAWEIFTQQIFILPAQDLLIVRLGHDPDPYHDEWREVEFLNLVLDSLEN
jgi:CubicO group peptidase (beta-lactamase class C family)